MRLGDLELVKPSTPMKGFVRWLEGWWWWCGGGGGGGVGVEMTSAVGGPGAGQAFNTDEGVC